MYFCPGATGRAKIIYVHLTSERKVELQFKEIRGIKIGVSCREIWRKSERKESKGQNGNVGSLPLSRFANNTVTN